MQLSFLTQTAVVIHQSLAGELGSRQAVTEMDAILAVEQRLQRKSHGYHRSMKALWVLMAVLVVASPQLVRAERSAGGSIDLSTRGGAEVDPATSERVYATSGHADLRALYGHTLTAAADFGFEVGAEVPGGFAYGVRLQPIGGAIRFGDRGWIGVVAGIGGSGVTGRVPIALELPVTSFVAFDLGKWIRVSSRLRSTWVATSDARADGSRATDIVDEIDFEAGIAIGKRENKFRSAYSDGTYVGVFVRDQVGQRVVGVSIAIAMCGAGGF